MLRSLKHWGPLTTAFALTWLLGIAVSAPAITPSDALLQRLKAQDGVRVYDFAGILKQPEKDSLDAILRGTEQKTGAQIAVVALDSLEGGQIDDFANKLFARWGIGQKGKNNGILLLVAIKDRKARIEVGYGLEPILPDALAGRILDEHLFPAFRQGRYADGLTLAARRICAIIEKGEPAPKPAVPSDVRSRPEVLLRSLFPDIGTVLFLSLFTAIGSYVFGGGLGARSFPSVFSGLCFGGIPMLMSWLERGHRLHPLLVFIAVAMGCLGLINGIRRPKAFRGWTTSRGSSWGGSSSWGGGFGGGSGGGGFGGGSSGGGGASGSW